MKQCTKCKEWKEESDFSKNKNTKDGLNCWCKWCVKEYGKKYKQANGEKLKRNKRIYYQNNKQKQIERMKKWQENNKEKIKEYKNNWYQKNGKKYRQDNIEIIKKKKQKIRQANAKYETHKDQLTIDESPRLAKDDISMEVKCRYCGKYFIPTNQQVENRIMTINGLKTGECGLYCSNGCKKSCPIYNQWKFPKGFKQATSREVQPELRKLVLLRDNYICQKCGSEEELHCHHIWPLNESPVTSADVDECVTLCKDCHKLTHKIPGCDLYELRCSKEIKL